MSDKLKDTLVIIVEHYTGTEEGLEYDHPYFVAHCDDIGLVTDADTLDELLPNIQEALSACLDGVDTVKEFQLKPNPRIMLTMDMTRLDAKTA
jgi:predicted RNase H-like HicB family nuclease